MDFGHLEYIASCSIFMGVQRCLFKSHRYKRLSRHIGSIIRLQLIVLSSLTFRPASVTHLRIGEDMIYTSVCQAFGFAHSCSCSKGVFWHEAQWTRTEFLNTKWRRHVLLPTLNSSYSKTYYLFFKISHAWTVDNQ